MIDLSIPLVFDNKNKNLREHVTEIVENYFYYGGKRLHVIDSKYQVQNDHLNTLGKCLILLKLFSLFTLVIPAAFYLARIVLNPRSSLTSIYIDKTKQPLTPSQRAKVEESISPPPPQVIEAALPKASELISPPKANPVKIPTPIAKPAKAKKPNAKSIKENKKPHPSVAKATKTNQLDRKPLLSSEQLQSRESPLTLPEKPPSIESRLFEAHFQTKVDSRLLEKHGLTEKDLEVCFAQLEAVRHLSDEEKEKTFVSGPFNHQIVTFGDLLRLERGMWINDSCINTYFEFAHSHCPKEWLRANSFAFKKPAEQLKRPYTIIRLKNGAAPNSLLDAKAPIFVPLNVNSCHWALLKIDIQTKTFHYYDSLSWKPQKEIDMVLNSIAFFAKFENRPFDVTDWATIYHKCPQQPNDTDCGIFTLMALDRLSCGLPCDYTAQDVPYMRLKVLSTFIKARL